MSKLTSRFFYVPISRVLGFPAFIGKVGVLQSDGEKLIVDDAPPQPLPDLDISDIDGLQQALDGKQNIDLNFIAKSSLTIDLSEGQNFIVTLDDDDVFDLSNIASDTAYYFTIYNEHATDTITIDIPNTDDVTAVQSIFIIADATREISLIKVGTTRYWQISEELYYAS